MDQDQAIEIPEFLDRETGENRSEGGSARFFRHQWGIAANEANISVHDTFSTRERQLEHPAGSFGAKKRSV